MVSEIAALCTLVGLQYALAWTSVRSPAVRRFVKSEPQLLVFQGNTLEGTIKQERITPAEIFTALRPHGYAALEDVYAVVLETEGNFSVIQSQAGTPRLCRSFRKINVDPATVRVETGRRQVTHRHDRNESGRSRASLKIR